MRNSIISIICSLVYVYAWKHRATHRYVGYVVYVDRASRTHCIFTNFFLLLSYISERGEKFTKRKSVVIVS